MAHGHTASRDAAMVDDELKQIFNVATGLKLYLPLLAPALRRSCKPEQARPVCCCPVPSAVLVVTGHV
jgi:hypothetical protein